MIVVVYQQLDVDVDVDALKKEQLSEKEMIVVVFQLLHVVADADAVDADVVLI